MNLAAVGGTVVAVLGLILVVVARAHAVVTDPAMREVRSSPAACMVGVMFECLCPNGLEIGGGWGGGSRTVIGVMGGDWRGNVGGGVRWGGVGIF